jgi:hypothetical protein
VIPGKSLLLGAFLATINRTLGCVLRLMPRLLRAMFGRSVGFLGSFFYVFASCYSCLFRVVARGLDILLCSAVIRGSGLTPSGSLQEKQCRPKKECGNVRLGFHTQEHTLLGPRQLASFE